MTVADMHDPNAAQASEPKTDDNKQDAPIEGNEPAADLSDVDAAEFAAAQAAVKAEEDGPKPNESGDDVKGDAKEGAEAKPGEEPAKADEPKDPAKQKPETPMIPKARFDEVLGQNAELTKVAYYYKGIAEAGGRQQPQGQGQQPAPQQITPQQKLDDIAKRELEVAEKFDNGEMTEVEKVTALRALRDEEWNVRKAVQDAELEKKFGRPAPQPQSGYDPNNDMRLEELTQQLETDHPFLKAIPDKDEAGNDTGYWGMLWKHARRDLAKDGTPVPERNLTSVDHFNLRKKAAELSDLYGPLWTGKTLDELKGTPAQAGQGGNGQPKPGDLSATAQARLNKLQASGQMPPDIHNLGASGNQSLEPSEQQILAMGEEELIANMPRTAREKALGW